jgi:hypothetical protein
MGLRFRRFWNLGPFRLSLSRAGLGSSIGVPGFRIGVSATGQKYFSIGIPGTGLYYVTYFRSPPPNQTRDSP